MRRVFYIFSAFIVISFLIVGGVLNYLIHFYIHQETEIGIKRDLGIIMATTQGALAQGDYERVEEQVFLWGEIQPNVVTFNVILDGNITIVKFARKIQGPDIFRLTQTVRLPNGRNITFEINYDLSDLHRKSTLIAIVLLSMSTCIAGVFVFTLWTILQRMAFIPLNREITERKEAELQREKLLKILQEKNDELQSIVYIASHDLKSPTVNIAGFSGELSESCKQLQELLESKTPEGFDIKRIRSLLNEDIPESLGFITSANSKISRLLTAFLKVSRVGTAEINIEPLDMNKLIANICQVVKFQIDSNDTEVVIDHLPDCLGDEKMIDQIFSNIMENALKYLDPERKGRVHISGRIEEKMSIYCIEDNGIGIDPDYKTKVFELFHRLNPDDNIGGEGIGLTIVSRALSRNNGRIWLESQPGKGSKFFVSVPTA